MDILTTNAKSRPRVERFDDMEKITLFCARCEVLTQHSLRTDHNEEFVAECLTSDCGRFLKFPKDHQFAEEQIGL